jgi:FKBP-type peptidyl-prolyl cis-trans isomerase
MKMIAVLAATVALVALPARAQSQADGAGSPANAASPADGIPEANISPRQRAELERAEAARHSSQDGAAFLAASKARPGVTVLASGVQYRVLKSGTGKRPTDKGTALCRYRGVLADGSVFDRGDDKAPIALRVAGLVPGLREALLLMPAGSRWEIVIPPALGFGARGVQGVGPNAVLIYTVDLVGVQ